MNYPAILKGENATERTPYTHSLLGYNEEGRPVSAQVCGVGPDGTILRANGLQYTGLEDTPEYEALLRDFLMPGCRYAILEGLEGYKRMIGHPQGKVTMDEAVQRATRWL